ncbi:tryptophan halogenase family protein [Glaciecola petra]|uniref:Tryptophan halogenase family protein n=1 Tax=Glaciecola petra TaxID=3075602 RepID=A0ABU2ZTV8_9ALTE|nr:tryptophan halogenase family protein [Aestuariibacter sp. P117]MDT0596073.1 tryptophan halogenase family protein [Aestuariibacter sp. P117]
MNKSIKKIAIVGGGTAGWLAAAIIASHHKKATNSSGSDYSIAVTLVESSDIPTVGVGEGTWPTMKNTLKDIGIKESDMFAHCHAVFKQGGKFVDWVKGEGDFYYHPFTVPLGYGRIDLAPYVNDIENYAVESNYQHHICEANLAPRTISEGEYSGQCNYAYHLDAGAFAELLKNHCKNNLGVKHQIGTVENVLLSDNGNINSVALSDGKSVEADLFIDCTGFQSLLLGKALGVAFKPMDKYLFNDSAMALHVPYENENSEIPSHTIATGQNAGWIWDIGLTSRRGVGHVYASEFLSDDEAVDNLRNYLGLQGKDIEPRKISFHSGHREKWWHKNCIAIGMAGGFVEPLEATAIMLIEISSRFVAENLPPNSALMPTIAKRFNQQMEYKWGRIIDFLKLHYMLTKRPEPYWQAHTQAESIPESLKEDLAIWGYRGPTHADFTSALELFPAASYQYVLYGMGFKPDFKQHGHLYDQQKQAELIKQRNQKLTQQMLQTLPKHRDYINTWLNEAKKSSDVF